LYLESDLSSSTIWSVACDSILSTGEKIITLPHAEGYPLKASLSPKSDTIAYCSLTETVNPATNGLLWVVGITDRIPRQVDVNIDYGWPPKWSDDGTSFAYIKKIPLADSRDKYRNEIYVGNINGETRLLFSDEESLEVAPVGWSPDGNYIYIDRIGELGDAL